MIPSELKTHLHLKCIDFVNERINFAKQAMHAAQESANQEEKSSAGDKYETGRAMAQLERDKAAVQVAEAMKLKAVLDQINLTTSFSKAGLGSVVITNSTNFYLSISAGRLTIQDETYLAISMQSPIGQLLLHKSAGDQFLFNNQHQTIVSVL